MDNTDFIAGVEDYFDDPLLDAPAGDDVALPTNKWNPRMMLDLAMRIEPTDVILDRYGLTDEQYKRLCNTPSFRRELILTAKDLAENGLSFTAKARVQAESYLPELDSMVRDHSVTAATRLEAIKSAVRWGKLEPKKEDEGPRNATQVNVNIQF